MQVSSWGSTKVILPFRCNLALSNIIRYIIFTADKINWKQTFKTGPREIKHKEGKIEVLSIKWSTWTHIQHTINQTKIRFLDNYSLRPSTVNTVFQDTCKIIKGITPGRL